MKNRLPFNLSFILATATCLFLFSNPIFSQATVQKYDNGIFDVEATPKQGQFGCFYILPDGTPRWSCDFEHQFSQPINANASAMQWKLRKGPIPPATSISLNPGSSQGSLPGFSGNQSTSDAIDISTSWNPSGSYFIIVVAVQNNFCSDPISGSIDITYSNQSISITNNPTVAPLPFPTSGVYIPSNWGALTPQITQTQNPQGLKISFQNLASGQQRFIHLVAQLNSASIGAPININSELNLDTGTPCSKSRKFKKSDFIKTEVSEYPWDPNTKTASKTIMCPNAPSEDIVYKIQFKNEGKAFAKDVLITDELSNDYDLSSFQLIDSSHPCPKVVIADRKVYFLFEDIQLPGTEQQNTSIFASSDCEGWLRFRINTWGNHTEGTVIQNDADIFFTTEIKEDSCHFSSEFISQQAQQPLQTLNDFFIGEASAYSPTVQSDFLQKFDDFINRKGCTVVLEPVTTPQAETTFIALEELGIEEELLEEEDGVPIQISGGVSIYPQPGGIYRTVHSSIGYTDQNTDWCFSPPIILSNKTQDIAKIDIDVYPNPMTNFINIKMPDTFLQNSSNFQTYLFDSSGRKRLEVNSQDLQRYQDIFSIDIDSSMEDGLYLLQVVTEKGVFFAKKILKN